MPLMIALGTGIVMLLYRLLPARKLPWRMLFAGALPVVLVWTLLTGALRLWVRMLAGFDKVYGSLASFFVLMVLIWVYSLTLLLGGEIAQRLADRRQESPDPTAQVDG